MFQLHTEQKNLQFELSIHTTVPSYIVSDESKIRQILINLLGNAVKFTEKGGIFLRVNVLKSKSLDTYLIFEVEDTGIGIAEDEIEKVFKPFEQTKETESHLGGTGLGLPICKEYAHLLKGKINLYSKKGKGSLFRVEIQYKEGHVENIEEKQKKGHFIGLEKGQPPKRILVVEDIPESRRLLIRLLESVGFDVRGANNGQDAIETCEFFQPHLIWMDIQMPVMDGIEATKRIKNTEIGKHTIIIALSASTFEDDRKHFIENGCDDFLSKPYQEDDIFEMIRKYLSVDYIYKDNNVSDQSQIDNDLSDDTLPTDMMNDIPIDWVKSLYHNVMTLRLNDTLDHIKKISNKYPDLARKLAKKVNDFKFDDIQDWIKSVKR